MNLSNPAVASPDLELDRYLEAFEAEAVAAPCDLERFLPPKNHPQYRRIVLELIRVDLELAWQRGEHRSANYYEARFPDVWQEPTAQQAIRSEEARQRKATVDAPSATLMVPVMPAWSGTHLPQVGDLLPPGFRIVRELGRGAFGRVYLAEEVELAGRWVAIKVSSKLLHEAQTLARLQHTNIVPIYSVHVVGAFQVVVMPYFGAATLADVLQAIRAGETVPLFAETLASVVLAKAVTTSASTPPEAKPIPALQQWENKSFTNAVLELAVQLADGLQHAHERGIQHRDLKPANILLTDDGRPMLLDFNLADDQHLAEDAPLGGTPRYMAPEQLEAMLTNTKGIGPAADLYAFGLILHELLLGPLPFAEQTGPWRSVVRAALTERRQAIAVRHPSPALRAILERCLAPSLTQRYATAAELRDDLHAHLHGQPLPHTPEPWSRERVRKWAKRHPRLTSGTSVALLALMVVIVVAAVAFVARENVRHLTARETFSQTQQIRQRVEALALSPQAPTTQLHDVRAQVRTALQAYPHDLQSRPARYLAAADQPVLAELLAALHYDQAEASYQLAQRERDPLTQQQLLEDARTSNDRGLRLTHSLTRPLLAQRVRLLYAVQQDADAQHTQERLQATPPSQPTTPYLDALEALQAKDYRRVVEHLTPLTRDGATSYTAWLALGTAHLALHEYETAVECFTSAAALAPEAAWPHYHRGVALLEAQQYRRAEAAFAQFLDQRPDEPDALVNQALALFHLGDYAGALRLLKRIPDPPVQVPALQARCYRALGNDTEAITLEHAARTVKPHTVRDWTIQGELQLLRTPPNAKAALAAFEQALKLDPNHVPALRGQISTLTEHLNRPKDAVPIYEQLLQVHPKAVEDRAGYAVVLARLGQRQLACKEARQCLKEARQAVTLYQAASALALSATTPADKCEVLETLREVLRREPQWAKEMPRDSDLQSVHAEEVFKEIVQAARILMPTK